MTIKSTVKKFIPKNMKFKARSILLKMDKSKSHSKKEKLSYLFKNYFKYKVYTNKDYAKRLLHMYKDISFNNDNHFIYVIDEKKVFKNDGFIYSNGSLNYSIVLTHSLKDLSSIAKNEHFKDVYEAMSTIINNIPFENEYTAYLKKMINSQCESFKEAVQRILFLNMIMWQTNHRLVGLGRLDYILDRYIKDETDEELLSIIKEFLTILHRNYRYKSNSLYGDTGQVIVLGGVDIAGNEIHSRLIELFIIALKELQIPDPKVVLRVTNNTSPKLLDVSCDCIQTGIGCPLLSNDEMVIKKMIEFGYKEEDANNYVVSACWEPFSNGKSIESNNQDSLNFLLPFEAMLKKEETKKATSLDELLELYYKELNSSIDDIVNRVNNFHFGDDYIVSSFTLPCIESGKTIGQGGAVYNDIGLTSVGLGNVVNSFIAMDQILYQNKSMTYDQLIESLQNEKFRKELKNSYLKFGEDQPSVITLTNTIIEKTKKLLSSRASNGRRFKFGLSSPSYISGNKTISATPDGRADGAPADVHISCAKTLPYTELIDFASSLNYGDNMINGNVIDYFVSPSIISNNRSKFVLFLQLAIKKGFYQMQMNVVSSKTLLDAKQHPENYKGLIVRVWGFSAYFIDLPEEYQNVLIERALINENAY